MLNTNSQRAIRQRPPNLPASWVKITGGAGIPDHVQVRDWQLVLNAAKIPYYISNFHGQKQIYTPPLYSSMARHEIAAYLSENSFPQKTPAVWRPAKNAANALFFLLPLVFIHLLNSGAVHLPDFAMPPGIWTEKGCLDKGDFIFKHQFYRAFTALTLHADLKHLSGNLFFGGFFLFLLARITGPGTALFLTIISGALGNLGSVYIHALNYKSVGFSTAVFSSLGVMAGIIAIRGHSPKKMLLPLGAVLGLLGLLGTEGENTDYGAHIAGLFSGFAIGLFYEWLSRRFSFSPRQILGEALTVAILAGAWACAFTD